VEALGYDAKTLSAQILFTLVNESWIPKVNLEMAYFLDLSHFLMVKTEISLRKVIGK
jgi:hypothetical protein